MNYVVCLVVITVAAIIFNPHLLVLVCSFSALWYALLTRPPNLTVKVGELLVSKKHLKALLLVLNALVVLVMTGTMIFATIGVSFLVIGSHAVLHNIPAKAHANKEGPEHAVKEPPLVKRVHDERSF